MIGSFTQRSFASALLSLTIASAAAHASTKVVVDSKASVVDWKGSKVTGSSHNGKIAIKEGEVEMDGKKLIGGRVVLDMNSITNEDLTDKEYNQKLVGHLKSDDFFDVAKYATATLAIKSSDLQADGTYKVLGDLTIKNETKPISFVAKLATDHKSADADLVIDRTEWNVRYGSGKFFTGLGDKVINDKIEFKVKLAFAASVVVEATPAKAESKKGASAKKKKSQPTKH